MFNSFQTGTNPTGFTSSFGTTAPTFGATQPIGTQQFFNSQPQQQQPQQQQQTFGQSSFQPQQQSAFGQSSFQTPPFQQPQSSFGATAQPAFGQGFNSFQKPFSSSFGSGTFSQQPQPTTTTFGQSSFQPQSFAAPQQQTQNSFNRPFTGSGFQSSFSTATNQGTGSPSYEPTLDQAPTTKDSTNIIAITAMPAYRGFSLEELRLQDYQMGKKVSGTGIGAGATSSFMKPSFGQSTMFSSFPATQTQPAPATTTNTGFGQFGFNKPSTFSTPFQTSSFTAPTAAATTTTTTPSTSFNFGNTSTQAAPLFQPAKTPFSVQPTPAPTTTTPATPFSFGNQPTSTFGQPQQQQSFNFKPQSFQVQPTAVVQQAKVDHKPWGSIALFDAVPPIVVQKVNEMPLKKTVSPPVQKVQTSPMAATRMKLKMAFHKTTQEKIPNSNIFLEPSLRQEFSIRKLSIPHEDPKICTPSREPRLAAPSKSDLLITPSLKEIKDPSCVQNLTIKHPQHGTVKFLAPVNLSRCLDKVLDLIKIQKGYVVIYPDESLRPEYGDGINVPAEVTLHNVFPISKATGVEIRDPTSSAMNQHIQKLKNAPSTCFKEYDAITGDWVFTIQN